MNINKNEIKGMIFDLDGTLIDSIPVWKEVDRLYIESLHETFDPELKEQMKAISFEDTAQLIIDHYNLNKSIEEVKKDWISMVHHHYANHIPLKEGAKAFLEECVRNNYKMMIASSCNRELIEAALEGHGISHYFSEVITSTDLNTTKELPDIYLYCANKMKMHPTNILVFEDISIAMKSACKAGFNVCAVYDADEDNIEAVKEHSHVYIRSYAELDLPR